MRCPSISTFSILLMQLLLTSSCCPLAQGLKLQAKVNENGNIDILMENSVGLLKVYSIERGIEGSDIFGSFNTTTVTWVTEDSVKVEFSVSEYHEGGQIIFTQRFPQGLNITSANDPDQVITSFPSFQLPNKQKNKLSYSRGFLAYAGSMMGSEYVIDRWGNASNSLPGGMRSTGPLVIFDDDGNNDLDKNHDGSKNNSPSSNQRAQQRAGGDAIVLSAFSQFMSANQVNDNSSNLLRYGIMGNVTEVPLNFEMKFIVSADKGINKAMHMWGEKLLKYYGKSRAALEQDLTINYLGYATDNGAWYYYNTEGNKSYEETLIEVRKQHTDKMKIPYRFLQIDSWWYYQDEKSWGTHGIKNWTAKPDVFPHGLDYVYNHTNWPYIAHNRFWSNNTDYAQQNGGDFKFCMDDKKSFPLEQSFWEFLFDYGKSWGLYVYEQDWLFGEDDMNHCTLSSATSARTWLLQMGRSAHKHGVYIQYCMEPSRFVLQSVEIPQVSQARASEDYKPGSDQWRIGITSIFGDALALAPLKDNFWSNSSEIGRYGTQVEEYPDLQAAVSTLSTASVLPSDSMFSPNVSLILKSVRADGMLLKPDSPAKMTDKAIISQLRPQSSSSSVTTPTIIGDLWISHSYVSGLVFPQVFAAESSAYSLGVEEIVESCSVELNLEEEEEEDKNDGDTAKEERCLPSMFSSSSFSSLYLAVNTASPHPLKTLTYVSSSSFSSSIGDRAQQPPSHMLNLPKTTKASFEVWSLSPVLRNGWSLLGDVSKWVPVASKRFQQIEEIGRGNRGEMINNNISGMASQLSASILGSPGETVTVYAAYLKNRQDLESLESSLILFSATCVLPESGSSRVTFPQKTCLYI
eukprot:jgi/Bigna1/88692/estExt_fgenesh1_pg.C_360112